MNREILKAAMKKEILHTREERYGLQQTSRRNHACQEDGEFTVSMSAHQVASKGISSGRSVTLDENLKTHKEMKIHGNVEKQRLNNHLKVTCIL